MAHGLLQAKPMTTASTPSHPLDAASARERRIAWAALFTIVALGALHYIVGGASAEHALHGHADMHPASHAILRRASTIPIAIAALMGGLSLGLIASGIAVAIYAPHAFFADVLTRATGLTIHADPSSLTERVSEVVTYLTLGALLGALADRVKRERARAATLDVRLQRTERELARAERLSSLGELVAGVAHEIRNPLTALITTGEVLKDAIRDDDPRHRMASLHMEELHRLGRVVERFLSFARPSAPNRRETSIHALLERAQALLESTGRQSDVEVTVAPTDAHASLDEDQLLQVVLNLGLNAIQASPAGATVELAAEVDDAGVVRLLVKDRGRGVPSELSERIFDPCVTTRADGSGLGLSIASRIAFAHDGALSLAPREGGGTIATLTLPGEPTLTGAAA